MIPLTSLQMIFGLFQLLLLFMFKPAMAYSGFFLFSRVSCLWINLDMGVCSQLVYSGTGPQMYA